MPKRRPFSSVQEITKDMTVEQRIERLEWHVNDIGSLKESSKRPKKELHEQASDEREDSNYKIPYGYLILKALMFFLFGLFAGLLLKLIKGV